MDREFLQSLGLSDDAAEKILSENSKDLDRLRFSHALDSSLSQAGAKNKKAVAALLDMDGLALDGEKISGLSAQLEKIRKESPYLFEADDICPSVVRKTSGIPLSASDAVKAAMGLKNL